jgi:DNA-binding CsgD family transcriptional regulator
MVDRRRSAPTGAADDVLSPLTVREREIFNLVAGGAVTNEIARELCVSRKTVATHVTRIHRKLGCRRVADLVRFAALHGLLRKQPRGLAPIESEQPDPALDPCLIGPCLPATTG